LKRPPIFIEVLLAPLAVLYRALMELRNLAYDSGLLKTFAAGESVISIGNLSAGGTGKTPITAFLCENLKAQGIQVGIISRGYGGTTQGPARVPSDGSTSTALQFGDEPAWIAARFPELSVFVGRDKVATVESLLQNAHHKPQLIIADDAFQHRRLKRDLDIVVVDASEPKWHERSLPLGRFREGFASLKRAQFVFLNKINLADPQRLAELRETVKETQKLAQFQIFEFESRISNFVPIKDFLKGSVSPAQAAFRSQKVLLISGIGRPKSFMDLCQSSQAEIIDHAVFPDHHAYTIDDFSALTEKARRLKVDAIFTTEKDAIKMANWLPPVPCFVSRLEVQPRGDMEGFYEAVRRLHL
jgi:tetraacyldisaccharide 4'-kinase